MPIFTRNYWAVLLAIAALAAGCRGPLAKIPGNPLARDTEADRVRYGRTPTQRVKELRAIADEIEGYPVAEREQITRALSEELQQEDDPRMRRELTRTLGFSATPASTSALLSSLGDPEVHVRLAACEALARHGNPSTISALARALEQDEDVDVRLAAARALGFFNHPQAVAALGTTLDQRDPALRNRGLLALRQAAEVDLGMDVAAWQQHVDTVVASLGQQDTSIAALPSTEGPRAEGPRPESIVPAGAPPPSGSPPTAGDGTGSYAPSGGSNWPVQPASGERSIYSD